ncbi:hypothetical protein A2627_02885 [Candidatus Woesebacteria bacterium RIFCSPHIGHO2_01_FULL_39_28]|uniref:Glycosyl transferase family 1 domain-containing protein n=1 Tax=Candidatus Woesebacteria bacterium RIFCSPHIGHO2_01_FULL_39_28 TaxID=1802496 RepID=A0A1F7YCH8_9BACT|nr:MAG: hypothetical protein A2627_02885 [Candidatus Woesebacteria bacterium RIFCSPHIGHO2_01_FULL_39_28]OGM57994.1 MAG: hypothetical protein A3A50_01895 [Candidatus Woesebacteria bacterium RIFCSPLOWO2_01_FULL_38_20]
MRIGIDVSQIIYETGVSWYTRKLVENLLKIDTENEYILFGGSLRRLKDLKLKTEDLEGNVNKRFFPIPPTLADLVWNRLHILPIEVFTGNLNVFHSSDWSQPPSKAFKITTVHDLSPIKFPEYTDPKIVNVHKRRFDWVIREVDKIIVPSKAVRDELVSFSIPENKIRVIPEAPTIEAPASKESIEKVMRNYSIRSKYLLSIGVGPRKNTQRIIEAFKLMGIQGLYQLVIVGEIKGEYEVNKDIIFTGHILQTELKALYSGAETLIYPSLDEGFGLPILDAFVCSCPVVTSNIGSMSEISGYAAVLVDPYEVKSIAKGVKEALENRDNLIKKGLQRVKQFSWRKTAQETLKVYQEVK